MLTKPMMRGVLASLSVVAVLAIAPLAGVGAATSPPGGTRQIPSAPPTDLPSESPSESPSDDCQKLRDDLNSALTAISDALESGTPDLDKILPLISKVIKSAQALMKAGCMIDPMTAIPPGKTKAEVSACAAPTADLLSQLYRLLSTALTALAAPSPDAVAVLSEVTKAQDMVTELTTAKDGKDACLR